MKITIFMISKIRIKRFTQVLSYWILSTSVIVSNSLINFLVLYSLVSFNTCFTKMTFGKGFSSRTSSASEKPESFLYSASASSFFIKIISETSLRFDSLFAMILASCSLIAASRNRFISIDSSQPEESI